MAFEKQRIVGTKNAPKLVSVSPAAPDILEFRVQQGYIVGGTQIAYQPEEGETLESDDRIPEITQIMKDGRRAGILVRDSIQGDQRYLWENLAGDTLDTCAAVDPSSYSVTGAQVCAVWRKTKPNDIAEYSHFHNLYSPVFAGKTKPDNITQGRSDFCYDHVFYLVLDHAPAEGDVLTLSFRD